MSFDRPTPWAFAAALALAGCASAPSAPDAATLIQQAQDALRGGSSKTLVVSGRGTGALFGQAWQPTVAWPGLNYSLLKRSYNLDTGSYREEFGRSRSEPNGGGATPLMGMGEARVTGFARDGFAWNLAGTANTAAPVALPGRVNDLWTTSPHSALAAAKRFGAVGGTRMDGGKAVSTLTFTAPGQLRATVVIDERKLVTRVESTMPHPVFGDTAMLSEFLDYSTGAPPWLWRMRCGNWPLL